MRGTVEDVRVIRDCLCTVKLPAQYSEKLRKLKDVDCDIKIEKHRKKRSLEANNYMWHLIGEIASSDDLIIDKEELKLDMLRHYGVRTEIVVEKDIDIKSFGIRYYDLLGYSSDKAHYSCYKGTSDMDSKEMATLLRGIEQEARQLDIPVKSDEEFDYLIKEWRAENG